LPIDFLRNYLSFRRCYSGRSNAAAPSSPAEIGLALFGWLNSNPARPGNRAQPAEPNRLKHTFRRDPRSRLPASGRRMLIVGNLVGTYEPMSISLTASASSAVRCSDQATPSGPSRSRSATASGLANAASSRKKISRLVRVPTTPRPRLSMGNPVGIGPSLRPRRNRP
jgi:hypothetical protein